MIHVWLPHTLTVRTKSIWILENCHWRMSNHVFWYISTLLLLSISAYATVLFRNPSNHFSSTIEFQDIDLIFHSDGIRLQSKNDFYFSFLWIDIDYKPKSENPHQIHGPHWIYGCGYQIKEWWDNVLHWSFVSFRFVLFVNRCVWMDSVSANGVCCRSYWVNSFGGSLFPTWK